MKHTSFDDLPHSLGVIRSGLGTWMTVAQCLWDPSVTFVRDELKRGVSPERRLSTCSELINKLVKCVSLLENGALSQEEIMSYGRLISKISLSPINSTGISIQL